jgi:hypothetical protein
MSQLERFACFGLALATVAISPASHATCWESGAGPTAVYRNPSVATEFNTTPIVITGRVLDERNISTPDDPEGYEWTIYTVKVLETLKGKPQGIIRLSSENTSARFSMETGKSYLLFVSQSDMTEMAGEERLPDDYVDNCGNSALVHDARHALKVVRGLSKVLSLRRAP